MPAEDTQERGRVAAALTKRWLESTTYIELPWNAYKHKAMCSVQCLGGLVKAFDLCGWFLDDQTPLVVENKGVTGVGDQFVEYREFLAIAYSSTVHGMTSDVDVKRHFIWATTHPFAYSADWSKLETHHSVMGSLEEFPEYLGGEVVDEEIARSVAQRIWILMLNPRQERVFLTPEEVGKVHTFLERKRSTL